ncbi:MAG: hypothetical protein K1X94_30010 [Sandaracinaceae bacterium]|nr:hypothetical protein [Sandaracinaceae bacterium]
MRRIGEAHLWVGASLVAATLATGCAREGILRLDVRVPDVGDMADRRFLVVEVAGDPSESQWSNLSFGTAQPGLSIPLEDGVQAEFDVFAQQAMRQVAVRVRYCANELCIGEPMRPSFRYVFARAIWVGHVTHFRIDVPPRQLEGTTLADVPSDPGEGTAAGDGAYPNTGWICRCQVACDREYMPTGVNCATAHACSSAAHDCDP